MEFNEERFWKKMNKFVSSMVWTEPDLAGWRCEMSPERNLWERFVGFFTDHRYYISVSGDYSWRGTIRSPYSIAVIKDILWDDPDNFWAITIRGRKDEIKILSEKRLAEDSPIG
jgi:hypothetical protein